MAQKDVRWIQRYSNYKKALSQLETAINLMQQRELSQLEKQGVIQAFEYTHELAWKTMKDFLENRGSIDLFGSRDVVRAAFNVLLIEKGEVWMSMIKSRNLTSHTYDESTADEIIDLVKTDYIFQFKKLDKKLQSFIGE